MAICGVGLVFEKEIMFEDRGVWGNSKENLTEINKDSDFKNRVRIEMYQLDLVVVQKTTKEIAGGKPKCPLEMQLHDQDLLSIGCEDFLTIGCAPLEDELRSEKAIFHKQSEVCLVHRGSQEHFRVRGCHRLRRVRLRRKKKA
jgi:hypothetical protein